MRIQDHASSAVPAGESHRWKPITTEAPTRNQTVLAAVTGATAEAVQRSKSRTVRALSPSALGNAMICSSSTASRYFRPCDLRPFAASSRRRRRALQPARLIGRGAPRGPADWPITIVGSGTLTFRRLGWHIIWTRRSSERFLVLSPAAAEFKGSPVLGRKASVGFHRRLIQF